MRVKSSMIAFAAAAALAAFAAACGGSDETEGEAKIPIECPTEGTAHTYDNFGKTFFETHCNSCHSAEGAARAGAPEEYVFDSRDKIVAEKVEIYEVTAGSKPTMPPGGGPSDEERQKLGEWLACDAP